MGKQYISQKFLTVTDIMKNFMNQIDLNSLMVGFMLAVQTHKILLVKGKHTFVLSSLVLVIYAKVLEFFGVFYFFPLHALFFPQFFVFRRSYLSCLINTYFCSFGDCSRRTVSLCRSHKLYPAMIMLMVAPLVPADKMLESSVIPGATTSHSDMVSIHRKK